MTLPIFKDHLGQDRLLACFKTPDTTKKKFAKLQDSQGLIPRSQWGNVDLRARGFKATVRNQGSTGSCVGHGSATAFTYAWGISGGTWREFSPCFIYGLINNGVDQGAVVGDALTVLKSIGVCLESTVPEGMIFSSQFPPTAKQEASRFKVGDAVNCPTFDDIGTAIQLGQPLSFGIDVTQSFNPDQNGVIPPPSGRLLGGHCMCVCGMSIISSRPYLLVQNSWSTSWGVGGFCYLGEEHFLQDANDNWALVPGGTIEDPNDTTDPKEPVVTP